MRNAFRSIEILCFVAWMLLIRGVSLAAFEIPIVREIPVGARACAMGEAFVALSDDGYATFWNPAGLSGIGRYEISSMGADLYGMGLHHGHLGIAGPLGRRHGWGMGWTLLSFDDEDLMYRRHRLDVSWGTWVKEGISFGVGLKGCLLQGASTDKDLGTAWGIGFNAGGLYRPLPWLRIGAVVRNGTDTKVRYASDGRRILFPRTYAFGIVVKPIPSLCVAFDVDDRLHLGIEHRPVESCAFRLGMQKRPDGVEEMRWSGGVGVRVRSVQVDYAYSEAPFLGGTHRLSASWTFGRRGAPIRIQNVRLISEHLYPAVLRIYGDDPVASVTVENQGKEAVFVKAGLLLPGLMAHRTETATMEIGPGSDREIGIPVLLDESAMAGRLPVSRRAEVTVEGTEGTRYYWRTLTPKIVVHGQNSWDGDARTLWCFVTPEETEIRRMAVDACKGHRAAPELRDFYKARQLFEALGETGIRYECDPRVSSYEDEYVQYPADLLHSEAGDCDDLSVFYASLLESVGIAAAFVDFNRPPENGRLGHLYVAFDTGVPEERAECITTNKKRYLIRGNGSGRRTVWIPVEVNLIGEDFERAWREGALEYLEGVLDGGLEQGWLRVIGREGEQIGK